MFGTNPVRKIDHSTPDQLRVQEIFRTIQGEGPYAGQPAIFIRMAGCNLRCHFCDTDFESHYENKMSVEEIVAAVMLRRFGTHINLVVITGGEPMIQNLLPLIKRLDAEAFRIQIETAGTVWIPGLELLTAVGRVCLVCSPKTPKVHPSVAANCLHWKYIINAAEVQSPLDGLPATGTQRANAGDPVFRPQRSPFVSIYLQPCDVQDLEGNSANLKRATDLVMAYGYILSMQVHKLAGLP